MCWHACLLHSFVAPVTPPTHPLRLCLANQLHWSENYHLFTANNLALFVYATVTGRTIKYSASRWQQMALKTKKETIVKNFVFLQFLRVHQRSVQLNRHIYIINIFNYRYFFSGGAWWDFSSVKYLLLLNPGKNLSLTCDCFWMYLWAFLAFLALLASISWLICICIYSYITNYFLPTLVLFFFWFFC